MPRIVKILLAIFSTIGCGMPATNGVPGDLHRIVQAYPTAIDAYTPAGRPVATNGVAVDLGGIDRRSEAVAACLGLPAPTAWPAVSISPLAYPSCVGPYLLLPVPAPDGGCAAKGQTPTAACPCRWRVGIEPDGAVLVPADLYNLGDALVRVYADVDDPWRDPALAACALRGVGLGL